MTDWCEVCQQPMVHRRGVLICPTCDLIRWKRSDR